MKCQVRRDNGEIQLLNPVFFDLSGTLSLECLVPAARLELLGLCLLNSRGGQDKNGWADGCAKDL